jgi:DNA-binding transcriptional ArsR family regulator
VGTIQDMDNGDDRGRFRKHADVLRVLSDPTRHEVVHWLVEGPKTVTQITALTGTTKSNISQHLTVLKTYGLVYGERRGREVFFSLTYPQVALACALIDEILLSQAGGPATGSA